MSFLSSYLPVMVVGCLSELLLLFIHHESPHPQVPETGSRPPPEDRRNIPRVA